MGTKYYAGLSDAGLSSGERRLLSSIADTLATKGYRLRTFDPALTAGADFPGTGSGETKPGQDAAARYVSLVAARKDLQGLFGSKERALDILSNLDGASFLLSWCKDGERAGAVHKAAAALGVHTVDLAILQRSAPDLAAFKTAVRDAMNDALRAVPPSIEFPVPKSGTQQKNDKSTDDAGEPSKEAKRAQKGHKRNASAGKNKNVDEVEPVEKTEAQEGPMPLAQEGTTSQDKKGTVSSKEKVEELRAKLEKGATEGAVERFMDDLSKDDGGPEDPFLDFAESLPPL